MNRRSGLRTMLAAFVAADAIEARHLARMLHLLDATGDPFARSHHEPGHFTASAFVLSPDETKLLLVFHGKLHRWLQPGGHVDPTDPTITHAARRELREEAGLLDVSILSEGPLDVDVHTIPESRREPAHEHFDVRFLFRAACESVSAGSDARAARWFALDSVEGAPFTDESVMRAVRKIRTRTTALRTSR